MAETRVARGGGGQMDIEVKQRGQTASIKQLEDYHRGGFALSQLFSPGLTL
jgi:hypothetical protein